MARRATKVKGERSASPYVLLLDAGNSIYGDEYPTQHTQGAVAIAAMNLLNYDAMALGAGDFQLGLETLRARIAEAEFPILSANVLVAETNQPFVTPYIFKDVGDYRVAILGLTDVENLATVLGEDAQEFELLDPVETAQQLVAELRPQADLIIALSHLGTTRNRQLADTVPGIDVIVGGLVRYRSEEPWRSPANGTLLVEADVPSTGHAGRRIGVLRLQLEEGGIADYAWTDVALGPEYSDDPEMSALLERYETLEGE